ncbi:HET-domain-containing protein, partial [Acephala macrosclerotiorum]
FSALSYVWGSSELAHSVSVDDQHLRITESLYSALTDVHTYMRMDDEAPEYLWADAICINQTDESEKSAQVAIMAEIYAAAYQVITYTGPTNEDTHPALELAFKCQNFCNEIMSGERIVEANKLFSFMAQNERLEEFGLPPAGDPSYACLRRLLRRTWSSRSWIVQESVMNKKNILMCGNWTVYNWDLLGDVVRNVSAGLLPRACIQSFDDPPEMVFNMGPDYVTMQANMRAGKWGRFGIPPSTFKRMRLSQLLRRFHSFRSSDPRDKIYAFLGMADDRDRLGIVPNYSRPIRDVYTEAAICIINADRTLDVLSSVRADKSLDLPSWVPDWSSFDSWRGGYNNFLWYTKYLDDVCLASGGKESDIQFTEDRTELNVRGILCAKLEVVSRVTALETADTTGIINTLHIEDADIQTWIPTLRECYETFNEFSSHQSKPNPYPGDGGFRDAFWRALVANSENERNVARANLGEAFGAYLEWEHATVRRRGRSENNDPINDSNQADVRRFEIAMRHVSWRRQLALTVEGYMATVPPHAAVGDHVCVLLGGRLPFIVRSAPDGKFTLLGDAYVHGLMNGE